MSEPAENTSKEMAEPAGSSENPAEVKKEWAKELPVEAMNHLFQGKRHLLVHDYSSAVSSLQEACELYVKFYGPMAYECGEIHYYYGKALLELARQETGILGDALEGGSDASESQENSGNSDEDAEGDKEDSAEDSKVDSEDAEESIGSSDQGKTDSDDQTKGGGDDAETSATNTEVPAEGSTAGCSEAGPSSSEQPGEKEEDITTLQLAWEVLETAKVIFQKNSKDSREDKLKVAEILLALGEISLEEENFQGSLQDLQECLRIHLQYLGPDDRLLAQTYYQLGLAYTFASDFDAALDSYQKSIDVIETRIGALKTQVVPGLPTDFSAKDPAKEIEELESLLPDIRAKIEDTEELKGTPQKVVDLKEELNKEEEAFGIPSKDFAEDSKKPISNLTHLLKRKKPEDQDSSSMQPAAKKLMTVQDSSSEPVTNGSRNNPTSASGV